MEPHLEPSAEGASVTLPALLSAVPMPLVLIDPEGRIAEMNARSIDLLGTYGTGRNYVTVLRRPDLLDCIEAAQRGGRPAHARYIHGSLERETVYAVEARPVAGATTGTVLLSFSDITDLERAEQMRRDFVANVSHELKTPLTALLGFVETLRGAARNDAAARDRFLGIMQREAERMNRLVSDLLSLSRVESTGRQRPRDPVKVAELVRSTVLSLAPMADDAGVTLEVALPEDGVPIVPGDSDQILQVLMNLTENAIKYGGNGGRVVLRVAYTARDETVRKPAVQIDVIDFGDGFDPIHIPRLTERFYRVDTHRSREMGGTGLGLAIAKHIVNRHRGRLRIESEPGEGSTFRVLLPLG